jgi:hypothetical protein
LEYVCKQENYQDEEASLNTFQSNETFLNTRGSQELADEWINEMTPGRVPDVSLILSLMQLN